MTMTVELVIAIGTALTGIIGSVGVILIALLGKKVAQVEKQGNSVSLELKRNNMVYARRLAEATNVLGDIQLANDTRDAYEEAVKQNEKL